MKGKHFSLKSIIAACVFFVLCANVNSDFVFAQQAKNDINLIQSAEQKKELVKDEAMPVIPIITADAAIVMDVATGKIIYEKNSAKQEYPASLTKMMTCILALENGRFNDIVTVSPYAADVESTWLEAGDKLRYFDMVQEMMLVSDNAAATALAEHIGGGEWGFTEMMNKKALEIGTEDTYFVNANGMPHVHHVSSARDLAKIARYGMQMPLFRRVVGTPAMLIRHAYPSYKVDTYYTTNDLMETYPDCIGIKTGYTRAAGGCLAAAARKDDVELLVIVLHSADHETRFTEAANLLDYGFAIFRK